MKLTLFLLASIYLFLNCAVVMSEENTELKVFPQAQDGMQRFVILLPLKERSEEVDLKVELIPGKMMKTDGVNIMRLGTFLEPHTVEGWGYTYYKVIGKDVAVSTLMAVPEGELKMDRFVTGMPLLVAYNSRLPIVIYAPKNYEIMYRVWTAPRNSQSAEKM